MINLEGFIRHKKTIKLGGKDFTFSELSIADFAKFRAWIVEKRNVYKEKRREKLISEAEKIGGIDPLKLLDILDKPLTDAEMEAEMETIEGIGYLAYLSLKYAYPEIAFEQAMEIMSIEAIEQITEAMTGGIKEEGKKKQIRARVKK